MTKRESPRPGPGRGPRPRPRPTNTAHGHADGHGHGDGHPKRHTAHAPHTRAPAHGHPSIPLRLSLLLPLLLLPLLFACPTSIEIARDASSDDASTTDASPFDATPDAGSSDARPSDDARVDPGDAGSQDADARAPNADASLSPDAGFRPNDPCRPIALACLPLGLDVIEVPTQMTAAQAFSNAQANQTIQVRGVPLNNPLLNVPPFVTVRGCQGANATGRIAFAGSGGIIEGLLISGAIVANKTGSYVVRYNHFRGDTIGGGEAALSARSTDALVSASVTMLVESNWFDVRGTSGVGVSAVTNYDTMTHEVTITIRNNIFSRVLRPIIISEGGLVGRINATIEHNTMFAFLDAMTLSGRHTITTSGNLFSDGTLAVRSSVAFEAFYSMVARITTTPPYTGTLLNGSFAQTVNPRFADTTQDDFRLTSDAPAIDQIPTSVRVPSSDYFGCPRPVPLLRSEPSGDIGALEAQPAP